MFLKEVSSAHQKRLLSKTLKIVMFPNFWSVLYIETVQTNMMFCCVVSPRCVHNGKEFAEGEVYRMDPCWLCQCRGGVSFCSKAECTEIDCLNFYVPEGECCPICIGTYEQIQHPLNGETWRLDECSSCTCRQGRVLCDSESCPPLLCHTPVRNVLEPPRAVNSSHQEFCVSSAGEILRSGDSWKPNACSSCVCRDGKIRCFSQQCPLADCRVPVLRKGQCCPFCLGIPALEYCSCGIGGSMALKPGEHSCDIGSLTCFLFSMFQCEEEQANLFTGKKPAIVVLRVSSLEACFSP
uniref:VWFC domain-containing protein n=1 Tax=Cyprinus carpio TaxID=7962 RepID=A0A8C1M845_CYPCA